MAKQINSTSTKIEKSFGATFFEKLKRHAVEYSGTSLMVGGLACCFKSIADQTMVKIAEGGIVNLLAETNMMRFGLSVSTLGMTAFVIGQLLNDRREQREKLEKSREAMESLKNSLLHDKSPDLALFLRGEGYKVNLRRELYGKERIPEIDEYYQALKKFYDEHPKTSDIFESKEISKLFTSTQDAIVSQNLIDDHRIEAIKAVRPDYSEPSFFGN